MIERPWMNWIFMAACIGLSLAAFDNLLPNALIAAMVLDGWNPVGLAGHMFLHQGFIHLGGNMIFLWVFGNAMCGMIRNVVFAAVFPLVGILAAVIHNLVDGSPAVGASGAIYGVIGFILATCPINRVDLFYWFIIRWGTFRAPVWVISLVWVAFDIYGAVRGGGVVAYWAHLGGFISGLVLGFVLLSGGWIKLTQWDNPTLPELLSQRKPRRPEW